MEVQIYYETIPVWTVDLNEREFKEFRTEEEAINFKDNRNLKIEKMYRYSHNLNGKPMQYGDEDFYIKYFLKPHVKWGLNYGKL
jgi:hypothetical protein